MSSVSARSHYVVRNGIRLHHLDWGNHGRHSIVLVHGSRLHAHVWNDFSRRFKDRFHIVAVDQRGHGDSEWCANKRYDLEELYEDLRAVLEARDQGVVSSALAHLVTPWRTLWDGSVARPQAPGRYRLVVGEYEEYLVDDDRPYDKVPTRKARRMVFVEHIELA